MHVLVEENIRKDVGIKSTGSSLICSVSRLVPFMTALTFIIEGFLNGNKYFC